MNPHRLLAAWTLVGAGGALLGLGGLALDLSPSLALGLLIAGVVLGYLGFRMAREPNE